MARPSDRWRRNSELFDGAAGQPAERRGAWLAAACQGDAELRREVESLLAEPASEATMGLAQAAGVLDATPVALVPGQRLGAYEVLPPLGAGGMGEVYRARDTRLGRDVAIKISRRVRLDPERLARFDREAARWPRSTIRTSARFTASRARRRRRWSWSWSTATPRRAHRGRPDAPSREALASPGRLPTRSTPRTAGHRPSRPQAGERQDHARRARQGARLRARQGAPTIRCSRPDALANGHGGLHARRACPRHRCRT